MGDEGRKACTPYRCTRLNKEGMERKERDGIGQYIGKEEESVQEETKELVLLPGGRSFLKHWK